MLVPLTDLDQPHARMMLELISDQKPFPASSYPRRFTEVVEPAVTRRRALDLTTVAIGVLVIGFAFAAKVAS